jgi:hypothetical protein
MIYLASPYTHADPVIREQRFEAACARAAYLLQVGLHVYSPIAHTHPIAVRHNLPKGFEFWQNFDFDMIERCSTLEVLCIDGWEQSVGVQAELAYAARLDRHITFSTPDGHGGYKMQFAGDSNDAYLQQVSRRIA